MIKWYGSCINGTCPSACPSLGTGSVIGLKSITSVRVWVNTSSCGYAILTDLVLPLNQVTSAGAGPFWATGVCLREAIWSCTAIWPHWYNLATDSLWPHTILWWPLYIIYICIGLHVHMPNFSWGNSVQVEICLSQTQPLTRDIVSYWRGLNREIKWRAPVSCV